MDQTQTGHTNTWTCSVFSIVNYLPDRKHLQRMMPSRIFAPDRFKFRLRHLFHSKMPWHQFRSSKGFVYVVVNLAAFIDTYLYGLIIPILPFALAERVHVPSADIQQWISVLLAAYGVGLIAGSRKNRVRTWLRTLLIVTCSYRRVPGR